MVDSRRIIETEVAQKAPLEKDKEIESLTCKVEQLKKDQPNVAEKKISKPESDDIPHKIALEIIQFQDEKYLKKREAQAQTVLANHWHRRKCHRLFRSDSKNEKNTTQKVHATLRLWSTNKAVIKNAHELAHRFDKRNNDADSIGLPLIDRASLLAFGGNAKLRFMLAIKSGNLQKAKLLLPWIYDINDITTSRRLYDKEQEGVSLLWWALIEKREDIALWLLQHGADPDQGSPFHQPLWHSNEVDLNNSPLIYLTRNNVDLATSPLARELIKRKAKVDTFGFDSICGELTALHWAVYKKNFDNVKFLCEHGANPTISRNNTPNAIEFARRQRKYFLRTDDDQPYFNRIMDLLIQQKKALTQVQKLTIESEASDEGISIKMRG